MHFGWARVKLSINAHTRAICSYFDNFDRRKAIGDQLEDALHGRNPINGNERELIEDARRNLYFLKKHPAA
jgi:hypothetical protein